MLGGDLALVGGDLPQPVVELLDGGDRGVAVDRGAAVACALGQRLGQVGGLDVAVIGVLDGAEQALGLAERPDFLDLFRRQDVDLDADRLGNAGIIHVFVPAVLGAGETDVGDLREADIHAGFLLQFLVELDRVFVDLADRIAHVEQGQQAGGVPGRARRQLLALDEHGIVPAFLGQVVERGNPYHAPADDDCARM